MACRQASGWNCATNRRLQLEAGLVHLAGWRRGNALPAVYVGDADGFKDGHERSLPASSSS
jgi:hypothetical protein